MRDIALARKYRPRTFEQMVGQPHVVQALTNALVTGRLHHAYLFTGTRGIGKTTISRILAKSLNCTGLDGTGGVTAHPCGRCTSCLEIDADRFIDYIELDAASNRSIDEVRDLIERAAYKPSVGRYKVFMIDEAHQLTRDAFNALLKTLEEPPEYLKFVLATTDPERMLPTVLSRCLQFNLRPMAPEVVQAHLQSVLQAESVPHDAGALRLLARAARGSMRDALSLTDQAIAYGGGRMGEDEVRAMLGSVDRQHAARIVQALARRDGAGVLGAIDALRTLGLSASGTLEEIAMLLQQMAIEQAVPGALAEEDPDTAQARQLAGELPADETQLLYSIVVHGRSELGLIADEYGALTMVLLRMLAFPAQPQPAVSPQRSAPLAGTPREARASAPARTAIDPGVPVASRRDGATGPDDLTRASTPAPRAGRRATVDVEDATAREPPPWLDEAPPDPGDPGAGANAVDRTAPVPAPSTQLVRTEFGDRWAATVRTLSARGHLAAMVRELALQAELVGVEDASDPALWRLRVEREALRSDALRDKLGALLESHLGRPLTLLVEAGATQDTPARREAQARARAQREAEELIREDPAVRELMSQFATARIVPGSIKPITSTRNETP